MVKINRHHRKRSSTTFSQIIYRGIYKRIFSFSCINFRIILLKLTTFITIWRKFISHRQIHTRGTDMRNQIQHSLWILIFIDLQKCRHGLFAHACTFIFYTIKSHIKFELLKHSTSPLQHSGQRPSEPRPSLLPAAGSL